MPLHEPFWFSNDRVMVSTALTCGLAKGGKVLPLIDKDTGAKTQVIDPETGETVDAVNDQLLADMKALVARSTTETLHYIPQENVSMRAAVPVYYDQRYEEAFFAALKTPEMHGFHQARMSELLESELISVRGGHGSPSTNQRVGDVPYIKVSDLRAGLVNINPTNRVPTKIAERHWKGCDSGLRPFDLLCPERTSKNIGDFCVLMPGQERVLLTKEIIVLRPGQAANFDAFFLLWAMTLKIVRDQWKRIVFMQTNREDVGKRYLELLIPVPDTQDLAQQVSGPFRDYYNVLARERAKLVNYLSQDNKHHFFVSGAEAQDLEELAMTAAEDAAADTTTEIYDSENVD